MKVGKPQKVSTLNAPDGENANPQKSSEEVDELALVLGKASLEDVKIPDKVGKSVKSEVDSLSLKFIDILQMYKDSKKPNKFVVSKEQLNRLSVLVTQFQMFQTFDSWYKFFTQKGVKRLPVLFSPFKRNHKTIYNDQVSRAQKIVDHMSQKGYEDLITMDGHGRLIYSIVHYVKQNKKVPPKIHLVDIDKTTNEFHKKIFPKDVFETGDHTLVSIPKEQDILNMDPEFLKTVRNPLLYLNFCGISCCSVGRTSGRDRVKKFLQEWLKNHSSVMISVSLRPHGFDEVVDGTLTNYGMIKQFGNIELVSKRSSFVTYLIHKSDPQ
jgi:hypothetical protein